MRYLKIPLAAIVILAVANFIAWGGFVWSYQVFTHEDPILSMRFKQVGKQHYRAYIESPEPARGEYVLYGDQWRVDARFVKMKYWANLLGMESRYAMDRLQGRYMNVEDENTLPHIAHQLTGEGISYYALLGLSPFVDTEYGTSTYRAIDDSKRFHVFKTPTGIMVRSEPLHPDARGSWLEKVWRWAVIMGSDPI